MKKALFTALILSLLASLGTAFAQSDSHDVEIQIPTILSVRIVDGGGALAANPKVTFDYRSSSADVQLYIDAVNAGGGDLAPTAVTDFSDVQVFSNQASWSVYVSASALGFTQLDSGITSGAGIALSDIVVTPTGTKGANVSTVSSSFALDASTAVATGVNTSGGWQSLGFSGGDYALAVNGDENPGMYTTTVTYSFTAP